jgi:hypothetical protein
MNELLFLASGLCIGLFVGFRYGVWTLEKTVDRLWEIAMVYLRRADIEDRAVEGEIDRLRGFIERDSTEN